MNLIPEWETDTVTLVLPNIFMEYYNETIKELEVFYAEFLIEIAKYDRVICIVPDLEHANKMVQLTGLNLSNFRISDLEDIWIRDFAQVQSTQNYLKFIYQPSYDERETCNRIEKEIRKYFYNFIQEDVKFIDLKLEGGNFIHNGKGTAIVTDKLYYQNPDKTPEEINQLIKETTLIEKLVVVPTQPGDMTGHIDGMIKWISDDQLFINDYQTLTGDWDVFLDRFNRSLERQLPEFKKWRIPYSLSDKQYLGWFNEEGNYLNFLITQNRVYAPIYNRPEDENIKKIFNDVFDSNVSFIDSGAISKYGGVLHCLTWNYRS